MEQLIEAFGIDVKLIAVQIVNFVILAAALTYFLYKPILNALKNREEKISQGLQDAESAAKAKEAANEEKQTILSDAHKEAEDINSRAKVAASEQADAIVGSARDKADAAIQAAQKQGEEIKAQAQKESEAEVAKVAILAAEKILKEKSA